MYVASAELFSGENLWSYEVFVLEHAGSCHSTATAFLHALFMCCSELSILPLIIF